MVLARPAPGVAAAVAVTDTSWGTSIELRAVGWTPGAIAVVTVVGADGKSERVGSWSGLGPVSLTYQGSTWQHRKDLVAVQVRDTTGHLEAQLPARA